MSVAPLLRFEAVGKIFEGGTVALDGFDFDVREGEFVSLLGPSGCGKSTALRMIAGLTRPTTGRILWSGSPRLSIVFQEPALMPWATVADNVWLPLRLGGEGRRAASRRVDEALDMVGLLEARAAYPRELSGGMKMRASIARALVTRPDLILMDEPFAALDEITRFRLNGDLLALRKATGATVVFVTHSIFESVFLSDRVAVMSPRPGRVVATVPIGTTRDRDEAFRTSAEYAERTRAVSEALRQAMGEPV